MALASGRALASTPSHTQTHTHAAALGTPKGPSTASGAASARPVSGHRAISSPGGAAPGSAGAFAAAGLGVSLGGGNATHGSNGAPPSAGAAHLAAMEAAVSQRDGGVGAAAPSEDATFITRQRAGGRGDIADPIGMDRVKQLHTQLNAVVGTLNEKVSGVLRKQESEFLRAYRAHMYSVQKELSALRAKADDAALQLAKNERIRQLEAERDWYRSEALRLDAFCSALKNDVEYMRDKLAALEDDRAWLETQLKASKRSITLMKSELSSSMSVAPTDGSVPHGGGASAAGRRRTPSASPPSSHLEGSAFASMETHTAEPPADSSAADAEMQGSADESATRRPATQSKVRRHHEAIAVASSMASEPAHAHASANAPPSMYMALHTSSKQSLDAREASLRAPVTESKQDRDKDNGPTSALVRQLQSQLSTAHKQVEALRTKHERLKAANMALRSSRSELETFFLQCIEDVRKEVARRRVRTVASSAAAGAVPPNTLGLAGSQSSPTLHAGGVTARGQGVTGTSSYEAALDRGAGVDMAVAMARAKTVTLGDFTAADRRAVVSKLLEDEYVLQSLHDVIFQRAAMNEGSGEEEAGAAVPATTSAPPSPSGQQEDRDGAETLDSTRVLLSPAHPQTRVRPAGF